MYCPICGQKLEINKPKKPDDLIEEWWELPDREMEIELERIRFYDKLTRYECICKNQQCSYYDLYFYYHHPDDVTRSPGDSWSITYLK